MRALPSPLPALPLKIPSARSARRGLGSWWGCLLAVLLFGLGPSCARLQGDDGELLPIERLAFVPKGRYFLRPSLLLESHVDLLVGRHEVTRGEWRAWAEGVGTLVPPEPRLGPWAPGTDSLPATGMDLPDARAFAAAMDMRLPTVMEWAWCVAGPKGHSYPYGRQPFKSAANTLEVGLNRPMPVGTFPIGRSSVGGIADLFGNVEEWAIGPPEGPWIPSESREAGSMGLAAWAMGGSWREPAGRLYDLVGEATLLARELEPEHRAVQLGMRLVTEPRAYLRAHGPELSHLRLRPRLVALGVEWGEAAVVMLTELEAEGAGGMAIQWLLEGARR